VHLFGGRGDGVEVIFWDLIGMVMASVYQINKGVSRPIEFKGLKAQYIAYLAVGLVILLVLFAALYIAGTPIYIVLPLVLVLGTVLFFTVFRLSHRFGEHGLMKFFAKRGIPRYIRFSSRRVFTGLKGGRYGRF
jgi:hypothetical protein